ncbi:HAD family phosphatase [Candidatus Parcubacteria bacterium]|nr:HAD family phosphatase [Candidatus Parcubacteria bacterium]
MKPINYLTKKILNKIKLIVFDVDGVLVPRGTKIKQKSNWTTFETKIIAKKQINQIKKLRELGFLINISSGRGLYMLQDMFREILPFTSLTYENGSATWFNGNLIQHINSYKYLREIFPKLQKISDKRIKGFEPKEFIITIHCHKRMLKIENIVSEYENLYTVWNEEAYDIGVKNIQTKGNGLTAFIKHLKLKKRDVLAIGDNYNDKELIECAGVKITADKSVLNGDFYVPLKGKLLPADLLMAQIIKEVGRSR